MVAISSEAKAKINQILADAVGTKTTSPMVFGVTGVDDEPWFTQAGSRYLDDAKSDLVNEDSIFWVCSQTKLVTSLAMFQLMEQGRLTLDTPVADILPELSAPVVVGGSSTRAPRNHIKVGHLVNHTSGLFYELERPIPYGLNPTYTYRYGKGDPVDIFLKVMKREYPNVPLKADPGADFAYGYSTDVIGLIVERLSGKTLEEYFKEFIFTPIGMTSTTFYRTPELAKRAVPLYRRENGVLTTDVVSAAVIDHDDVNVRLGGVGLLTSVKDYLSLLRHLLRIHAGLKIPRPILSQETVKSLFVPTLSDDSAKSLNTWMSPHKLGSDFQWGNAICLNTTDWPGRRRKYSGWWFGWAGSYYFMDPTTGVAAMLGAQVIPTRDQEVIKIWGRLEEALYSGL